MTKSNVKKKQNLIIIFSALLLAVVVLILAPSAASAAEYGSESPYIYCTYTDSSGNICDGNNLTAGTYDVGIVLQGAADISVVQVTAEYTSDAEVDEPPVSLISESADGLKSMGTVAESGNLIIGFVSESDDSTAIDSEGATLAVFSVTFSSDCDAADVITVSTDPNKTFVLTSYSCGYDDEYALTESDESYSGELYLMACDVTPAFEADTYDITGCVKIATSLDGDTTTVGIVGIEVVAIDSDGETVASATTDESGSYTLSSVPAGEYTMQLSGSTTVDRDVTLVVTESKTVDAVGIVVCDYNKDNSITILDKGTFNTAFGSSSTDDNYNIYCDYNGDASITILDRGIFNEFFAKTVSYSEVTLK